jgi:tRNA nucleotidyltransferase (CCA-adding enzyme)
MQAGLREARIADATVRRWVASIGRTRVGAFMRVAAAVWETGPEGPQQEAVRSLYRRMARSALRDPVELADLAVDGDDLRRSGVAPGPEMGKILHALLAAVVEDPGRNTTDWLLQETERIREREQGGNSGEP